MTDEEIARSLQIASATVERVRRRCVEEGIEAALGRREQQRRRPRKLDGAAEAHPVSSTGQALIALACGEPPEGRARWTLRLLADRLVECEIVDGIHPETVRKTLKKTNSSPRFPTGQALAERVLVHPAGSQCGLCVRPRIQYGAGYGGRFGGLPAVLPCGQCSAGVYGRDQQAAEPALGHDRGLRRPGRQVQAGPGAVAVYDYEYERNRVSNLFMLFAPLEGRRRVAVTDRRTKVDWAGQMKQPVDEDYPDKDRIVLVMDNPVSWYGAGFEHPSPGLAVRGV